MAAGSARLADAHRLAQQRLGIETIRVLEQTTFPLLDLADVDGTTDEWLQPTAAVISVQQGRSARLAGDYLTAARALDLGSDPAFIPTLSTPNLEQILTSLRVVGPFQANELLAAGKAAPEVRRAVLASVSRSAHRLALAGGRTTVATSTARDRRGGWARVTSFNPCAFCAMLASRGAVYSERSVHFRAHDACSCNARAVYDHSEGLDPQARHFRNVWNASTVGKSGDEAFRAFRRALEGLQAEIPVAQVEAATLEAAAALPAVVELAPVAGTRLPTSALSWESKKAEARLGKYADALDRLHGLPDDNAPTTLVKLGSPTDNKGGHFAPQGIRPRLPKRPNAGESFDDFRARRQKLIEAARGPEIRVNPNKNAEKDHSAISFLHEFGHRTDFTYGPPRNIWHSAAGAGAETAAEQEAWAEFVDVAKGSDYFANARQQALKSGTGYYHYFTDVKEVWARAYSQWAAGQLSSEFPELAVQLDRMRSGFSSWYQWPDDAFEKVGRAVEKVLRARGLLQ